MRSVITAVMSASGRPAEAVQWLSAARDFSSDDPVLRFADPRWGSLDAKLLHALMNGLPAALKRKAELATEQAIRVGRQPSGLRVLCMIHEYYKPRGPVGEMMAIEKLMQLQLRGSDVHALAVFLNEWDHVEPLVRSDCGGMTRTTLFLRNVKLVRELAPYIVNLEMSCPESHPDFLPRLRECCERLIYRERCDSARMEAFGRNSTALPIVENNLQEPAECAMPVATATDSRDNQKNSNKVKAKKAGKGKAGGKGPGDRPVRPLKCHFWYYTGACPKPNGECKFTHEPADRDAAKADLLKAKSTTQMAVTTTSAEGDRDPVPQTSSWIVDSGASLHVVSMDTLQLHPEWPQRELARPVIVKTANGTVKCTTVADVKLPELGGLCFEALVLRDSPNAISAGLLAQATGLSLVLSGGQLGAQLIDRNGDSRAASKLEMIHNVPILTAPATVDMPDEMPPRARPTAAKGGGTDPLSREHLLLHMPRLANCDGCRLAKVRSSHARRCDDDHSYVGAKTFGDLVTLDHLVPSKYELGESGEKVALVVLDLATRFCGVYADRDKSVDTVLARLRHFYGDHSAVKLYSDGANELRLAAARLRAVHETSTPYRPKSNGVIERQVQTVVQAARTLLHHSGVPIELWTYAVSYVALAMNAIDVGGDSPWKRRFGEHCLIPMRPFGCLCSFRRCAERTVMRKFDHRGDHGVLLGYVLQPGCVWKGDFVVASLESFARESRVEVHTLREVEFGEAEVFPPARARGHMMEKSFT